MREAVLDVTRFHTACGILVNTKPTIVDENTKEFRKKLIYEEAVEELFEAMDQKNIVEIADAIADSLYVLIGTAISYGIPIHYVWEEVQRSNMAKVDPETGKVKRREDGKILKPDGWKPPTQAIAEILADYK